MKEPDEVEVSSPFRALYLVGLVVCTLLMCIISGAAFMSSDLIDPFSMLALICLFPVDIVCLALYLYTFPKEAPNTFWTTRKEQVFIYNTDDIDREVDKFKNDIWGWDLTLEDIKDIRVRMAKKYHPDQKEPYLRAFNDEVLSFINGILTELASDIKKHGHIDWKEYQ